MPVTTSGYFLNILLTDFFGIMLLNLAEHKEVSKMRKNYPSDITKEQFESIREDLEQATKRAEFPRPA